MFHQIDPRVALHAPPLAARLPPPPMQEAAGGGGARCPSAPSLSFSFAPYRLPHNRLLHLRRASPSRTGISTGRLAARSSPPPEVWLLVELLPPAASLPGVCATNPAALRSDWRGGVAWCRGGGATGGEAASQGKKGKRPQIKRCGYRRVGKTSDGNKNISFEAETFSLMLF